jgi:hypothetical protein
MTDCNTVIITPEVYEASYVILTELDGCCSAFNTKLYLQSRWSSVNMSLTSFHSFTCPAAAVITAPR